MDVTQNSARRVLGTIAACVVVIVAGWIGSGLLRSDEPLRATPGPSQETAGVPSFSEVQAASQCDKVTTYVCPDGTCLCEQQNCASSHHNGDVAPCNGPPAPGCQHNFAVQYCFPVGQAINCSASGVPVGDCAYPCGDGGVRYTTEGRCCRGERTCTPPHRHAQPVLASVLPAS